ncbi:amidase, Asp-tRNAAsn/Glu-tRNAGln amidotransferase A subunit [Herbaspirillum sp. CF444]|uniref:amidase n=1 Tax=Herbaspirillum sp. CF444 TaxID=1144319 RepID=UPI0002723A1F|nr:amidase [Herbaspirillum sp. CF444]EJL88265.1 amidase, Asp-tRNAAsn/Glu-tRNAGln amidotransferase A subunit [Herbaspirillum sp. CF444]
MIQSLHQQSEELRDNGSSSLALTELALQRAAAADGEGARVFTRLYADSARAAASASDTLRSAGIVRSPIEGLPVSIKDLFDVAGETTLAGSVALRGYPAATESAVVVKRLIAAGAVIVGRTNMTEFAYSGLGINPHYGTPRNPWQREVDGGRIPGGSSSGAAISVTDGMAVAGVGSDTGGSIRIPAAFCGITGFKPTARRVPMQGVLPLSENLDSIGAMAPTVLCCAMMDAVLAGEEFVAPVAHPLRGLRLLYPTNVVRDGMDEHVAAGMQAAIAKLSAAGAVIVEQDIPAFNELAAINAKGGFTAAEAWAWHRQLIAERKDHYDQRVVSRILRGKDMSAADLLDVLHGRRRWIAKVEQQLAGYDALLMPTVPIVAPKIADLQTGDDAYYAANGLILRNPTLVNFLDGCAVSLPCHAAGTAPVGLSLAAAGGNDHRLLSIALAVETLLKQ